MKTLWFKARYVTPILNGEKSDTIRRRTGRYRVEEIVALTVGPRPPFAIAQITGINPIMIDEIEPARRQEINNLFEPERSLERIQFVILKEGEKPYEIEKR